MVTEDALKSVAPPPKASKPFKKAGLPEGLNYELLRHTVVPTTISYVGRSRDPWDRPASILCNEIRIIIRHTGRVDFEVDPKGAIYKNVSTSPSKLYPCSCNSSIGESTTDRQLAICYWFGFSCTYHNIHIQESEHAIPYAEEGHKVG